uniref:Ig-like domain-containing protein n=1 Tax=Glossina brevipalpis TaxID=37001 RepID=A0A1A9WB22_9MUSC
MLGYPQPTYRWLKNGIPIGDFSSSQYLRILNTQREDAGSYKCIAKNDAGSIFSEKIDVIVAYMGIFNNNSEGRLTVTSGHPAIFEMPAIDSAPSPSVMWQTKEGPLNYDIKYAFTKANQLIILSADEVDRKAYRARAINTQLGKEENSAFIYLNVTGDPYVEVPPEIIVFPEDMKLRRGEQVAVLQCIANARPLHELETIWLKDGIPIENAEIAHTLNDPWNRSLALLSVNLTHSGEYTCQVRLRSGGYKILSSSAKIEILEPPSFFTPMRQETYGELGALVTLPCDVVGEPQPYVTWFKNSEPIDANNEKYSLSEDNSLQIKKLSPQDSAMFQCLAVNEAGEKSAYTWLRVKTTNYESKNHDTFNNTYRNVKLASKRNGITEQYVIYNVINTNKDHTVNGSDDDNVNAVKSSYVSNLLQRIKRMAQPRILRAKTSHAGLGSGYNRRKDIRFGNV